MINDHEPLGELSPDQITTDSNSIREAEERHPSKDTQPDNYDMVSLTEQTAPLTLEEVRKKEDEQELICFATDSGGLELIEITKQLNEIMKVRESLTPDTNENIRWLNDRITNSNISIPASLSYKIKGIPHHVSLITREGHFFLTHATGTEKFELDITDPDQSDENYDKRFRNIIETLSQLSLPEDKSRFRGPQPTDVKTYDQSKSSEG